MKIYIKGGSKEIKDYLKNRKDNPGGWGGWSSDIGYYIKDGIWNALFVHDLIRKGYTEVSFEQYFNKQLQCEIY